MCHPWRVFARNVHLSFVIHDSPSYCLEEPSSSLNEPSNGSQLRPQGLARLKSILCLTGDRLGMERTAKSEKAAKEEAEMGHNR